jgi:hypothetical protein
MGVDTKGKIKAEFGVKDIQRSLKHKFNIESKINNTGMEDYYYLSFEYNNEKRMISVFENYKDDETKEIGTHLRLSMWGSSVELMKGILESFGGFIIEDDYNSDEWKYISPTEKINLTEEEILEDNLYQIFNDLKLNFVEKQRVIEFVKKNLVQIKSL